MRATGVTGGAGRLGGLLVAVALTATSLAQAQLWGPPKAEPWPRWEWHAPTDLRTSDHGAWDRFLQAYLDARHPSGIHRLDYARVTSEDRRALEAYLQRLQAVSISTHNRAEQLAYWVNLYNAATVKLVLDRYPVASIRQIKSGLLSSGPWDQKLLAVEGERLSLNDIEHRILRPIWRDPRIHYAVNCASLGCPNLAPVAYTAENVDRLLTEGAVAFVNHPRGAALRRGRLHVSSIYEWFQDDFGGSRAGVLQHLRHYARGDLARALEAYDGPLSDSYDWNLNSP
jgi:hypothetical protein